MFGHDRFAFEFQKEFADRELIFSEGDSGRELYIIQEGEIVIEKKSAQGPIILATFRKGDVVGEMSLLESRPRFASAYAKGATRVLVIKAGGFLLKIRRDPTFAFELLQSLSMRIRVTNERLLEAARLGNLGPELLAEVLSINESSVLEKP
jgi:CRP/FNR family cyclic AMP-dependent transcriptional regulator